MFLEFVFRSRALGRSEALTYLAGIVLN